MGVASVRLRSSCRHATNSAGSGLFICVDVLRHAIVLGLLFGVARVVEAKLSILLP